jgi:hypothetical protein
MTTNFTLAGSNLYRRVRHSLRSNDPRRPFQSLQANVCRRKTAIQSFSVILKRRSRYWNELRSAASRSLNGESP